MKDLVKPNSLENDYQRAEQFCESGYTSSCDVQGSARACSGNRESSIEGSDDILF